MMLHLAAHHQHAAGRIFSRRGAQLQLLVPAHPLRLPARNSCMQRALHQDQQLLLPPELEGFRPNVGVCVFNAHTGLVFAARRLDDNSGSLQMPQGGVDVGESPREAALRELLEETSISSVQVVAELPAWLPYEFPTAVKNRLSGSWAQYKGQAQRWFLLKFTGEDDEVCLETEHREFRDWCWMPLHELPVSAIHFKQAVYARVADEFGPLIAREVAAAAAPANSSANAGSS